MPMPTPLLTLLPTLTVALLHRTIPTDEETRTEKTLAIEATEDDVVAAVAVEVAVEIRAVDADETVATDTLAETTGTEVEKEVEREVEKEVETKEETEEETETAGRTTARDETIARIGDEAAVAAPAAATADTAAAIEAIEATPEEIDMKPTTTAEDAAVTTVTQTAVSERWCEVEKTRTLLLLLLLLLLLRLLFKEKTLDLCPGHPPENGFDLRPHRLLLQTAIDLNLC